MPKLAAVKSLRELNLSDARFTDKGLALLAALPKLERLSITRTRVTEKGRVRHSTPDVVDARNALALRYRLPTVLVEGRRWSRGDPPTAKAHVLVGMERALSLIVRWAQENALC